MHIRLYVYTIEIEKSMYTLFLYSLSVLRPCVGCLARPCLTTKHEYMLLLNGKKYVCLD